MVQDRYVAEGYVTLVEWEWPDQGGYHHQYPQASVRVCACVRVCVSRARACVRACMRDCVRA